MNYSYASREAMQHVAVPKRAHDGEATSLAVPDGRSSEKSKVGCSTRLFRFLGLSASSKKKEPDDSSDCQQRERFYSAEALDDVTSVCAGLPVPHLSGSHFFGTEAEKDVFYDAVPLPETASAATTSPTTSSPSTLQYPPHFYRWLRVSKFRALDGSAVLLVRAAAFDERHPVDLYLEYALSVVDDLQAALLQGPDGGDVSTTILVDVRGHRHERNASPAAMFPLCRAIGANEKLAKALGAGRGNICVFPIPWIATQIAHVIMALALSAATRKKVRLIRGIDGMGADLGNSELWNFVDKANGEDDGLIAGKKKEKNKQTQKQEKRRGGVGVGKGLEEEENEA